MQASFKCAFLSTTLVLFAPGPAIAQITFGTYVGDSCYPFNCAQFTGLTQWQQVYSASAFNSGVYNINSVKFYASPGISSSDLAKYSIYFSTTTYSPAQAASSSAPIPVTNGTFFASVTNTSPGADLFVNGTPVAYNTSSGNLVMTVVTDQVISGGWTNDHYQFSTDPTMATVYQAAAPYGPGGWTGGLVTTFNSAPSGGLACFLDGTEIATPFGSVPVSSLKAGDIVWTVHGWRAIAGIGMTVIRRDATGRLPLYACPIRIRSNAFGEGLPRRDLYVSKAHAIFARSVLIDAGSLENGVNVSEVRGLEADSLYYFHIDVGMHTAVLAEGLPCETLRASQAALSSFTKYEALRQFSETIPYEPFAPMVGYKGARSELASLTREVASLLRDVRSPLERVRSELASSAGLSAIEQHRILMRRALLSIALGAWNRWGAAMRDVKGACRAMLASAARVVRPARPQPARSTTAT